MKRVLLGAIAAVLAVQSASARELRVGVQNMNNYLDPGSDHPMPARSTTTTASIPWIDRDHGGSGDFAGARHGVEIVSPQMIEFTRVRCGFTTVWRPL
ncbi:hypothetical protein DSL92_09025 [Billgrantia gudaonensis]|uniref:Uncharacterized protein n=1 Tax=Billgrantia gudaonensis TaxID=376427 RepID=A0A432JI01_9GAMM|nr:hypothetical protein DSL92_09025 [Halomonas gudaonensis]